MLDSYILEAVTSGKKTRQALLAMAPVWTTSQNAVSNVIDSLIESGQLVERNGILKQQSMFQVLAGN